MAWWDSLWGQTPPMFGSPTMAPDWAGYMPDAFRPPPTMGIGDIAASWNPQTLGSPRLAPNPLPVAPADVPSPGPVPTLRAPQGAGQLDPYGGFDPGAPRSPVPQLPRPISIPPMPNNAYAPPGPLPRPGAGRPLGDIAAAAAPNLASALAPSPPQYSATNPSPYQESAPPASSDTVDRIMAVTRKHESGDQYGITGPKVTYKDGRVDYPYGAYQVMGANIGPWTKEVLGRAMTPQEFLANPQAQDAVARAKMSQYLQKTGSVPDVFAMWASGRPLSESANNRDLVFGSPVSQTVAQRMASFNAATGQPTSLADKAAAFTSGRPLGQIASNFTAGRPLGQMADAFMRSNASPTAPAAPAATPARKPYDWGPTNPLWGTLSNLGAGLMTPSPYGFRGSLATGLQKAGEFAQSAPMRQLQMQKLQAEVENLQVQGKLKEAGLALANDSSVPVGIRNFFRLGLFKEGMTEWAKRDPEGMAAAVEKVRLESGAKKQGELGVESSPQGIAALKATSLAKEQGTVEGKMAAQEAGMQKQQAKTAPIVLEDIDRAIKMASDQSWYSPSTGFGGWMMRQVGGTAASNLAETTRSIQSNVGLDQLNQLKAQSGAGLGSVTEAEHKLLQSVLGSLETSQTREQFVYNLQRVKQIYQQILTSNNGTPNPYAPRKSATSAPPPGFRLMQ